MNAHDTAPAAPDFAEVYARFSAGLLTADIPPSVIEAARLNVFDTVACSIAGFKAPGVQDVLDLVRDWGGKPEADVLWTHIRVPAPHAAWINGIMSHACDYDDTHDKAILHGGISVVPAALAAAGAAGRPVSGEDFYAAVSVGLELICRLGVATRIGLIQAGFIYSALFSYFAAAAAAARILRLTPEQTVNAIGIAYSQAGGTHQVTRDGALTKRMQPGFGAGAALTAVAMARKGVRGAQRVFEGQDGLSRIYLQSELDSAVLRSDLGSKWHFEDLAYKPYPSCRMNHCAIDAALEIRRQPGFDIAQVGKVRACINSQGNQAVGQHKIARSVVQAQFSIRYNIACALLNGRVGLSDFTSEALERPDVAALASRVEPVVDEEIEHKWGRNVTPARLEVEIGGNLLSAQVDEAKGGLRRPMSAQDLRLKLEDCLEFGGFNPASAPRFEELIAGLRDSHDVIADLRQLIAAVTRLT